MKAEKNDPLVQALESDDAAELGRQLAASRTVAELLYFGRTPLHFATAAGSAACVRLLLSHGADVEAHDEAGHTPLLDALQSGHAALAAELVQRGALLKYRFKKEDTPEIREQLRKSYEEVQQQAREAHPAIYKVLNSVTSRKERAEFEQEMTASLVEATLAESEIHAVHHCGNLDCLKLLARQPGNNFNLDDGAGYWPLKTFAESGDATAVEWLLQNGATRTSIQRARQRSTLPCFVITLPVRDSCWRPGLT